MTTKPVSRLTEHRDGDPYVVVTYGAEWFVVNVALRRVIARCDDEITAAGIASIVRGLAADSGRVQEKP